jgi:hypothetical protein
VHVDGEVAGAAAVFSCGPMPTETIGIATIAKSSAVKPINIFGLTFFERLLELTNFEKLFLDLAIREGTKCKRDYYNTLKKLGTC